MVSFLKLSILSLVFIFIFSSSTFAKNPLIVPAPDIGNIESDFAKDVTEGIQSIDSDNDGRNNQNGIDENELEEGEQENENVNIDEQIDHDEAQQSKEDKKEEPGEGNIQEETGQESQKKLEDTQGNENGKSTNIRNEDSKNASSSSRSINSDNE